MTNRYFRTGMLILTTAGAALGGLSGCDAVNPALLNTLGMNSVSALDAPDGPIVILVANRTDTAAAARVTVTKEDGGSIELTIPVGPFGSGTFPDHSMVVQDCDVESIQLLGISAEGEVEIPSFSPELRNGFELSCGKVVGILILAIGVEPTITVY